MRKVSLLALLIVWNFAAFGEEIAYRGYLLTRGAEVGRRSTAADWIGVVLTAVSLPAMEGIELTALIAEGLPKARVVIVSSHTGEETPYEPRGSSSTSGRFTSGRRQGA